MARRSAENYFAEMLTYGADAPAHFPNDDGRDLLQEVTGKLSDQQGLDSFGISDQDRQNAIKILDGKGADYTNPAEERKALDAIGLESQNTLSGLKEDERKAVAGRIADRIMESEFPGLSEQLNDRAESRDMIPAGLRDKALEWNRRDKVNAHLQYGEDGSWRMQIDCQDQREKNRIKRELEHMGLEVKDMGRNKQIGRDNEEWELVRPLNEQEEKALKEEADAARDASDRHQLKKKEIEERLLADAERKESDENYAALSGGAVQEVLNQAKDDLARYDTKEEGNPAESFGKMMSLDEKHQQHYLERQVQEEFSALSQTISTNQLETTMTLASERLNWSPQNGSGQYSQEGLEAERMNEIANQAATETARVQKELVDEAMQSLKEGNEERYLNAMNMISAGADHIKEKLEQESSLSNTGMRHPEQWLKDAEESSDPKMQVLVSDRKAAVEAYSHMERDDHATTHLAAYIKEKDDQIKATTAPSA